MKRSKGWASRHGHERAQEKEEDLIKETEKEQPLVQEDNEENEESIPEKGGLCKKRPHILEMYAEVFTDKVTRSFQLSNASVKTKR